MSNSDTNPIPDPSSREALERLASLNIHEGMPGLNKVILAKAALSREQFYKDMEKLMTAAVKFNPNLIRASVERRGYTIGEPLRTQLAEADAYAKFRATLLATK
jgi:hypothetical protein